LGYYLGSIAASVAAMAALVQFGHDVGAPGLAAASAAFFAAYHLAFLWYWRKLDEIAREAHRFAILWGGLITVYAGSVAVITFSFHPAAFPFQTMAPGEAFSLGLAIPIVLMSVLLLAGWAWWWLRRR
jgi:hypothetical protein